MEKKIGIAIVAVIAVLALVVLSLVFVFNDGDDGGDDETTMTFNGVDFTWSELESEFGTEVVDGNTGVPLGEIILTSSFGELESDDQNKTLFRITAEDGWQKNVSWTDLQSGILVEEDLMTYFPDLPGAYKVKNLATIEDIPLDPLAIINPNSNWGGSAEITWDELFTELNVTTFQNADAVAFEDVLDYAGFSDLDLENATFTIVGVDGYSKDVTWTNVQNGVLILDGHKSDFTDLTGAYKVRNIIRIIVDEAN